MAWQGKADPMEEATARWLLRSGIRHERADAGLGLDFYLPDFDLYIEVKRFHSPRIGEQMSRAENVIAVQGIKSFQFIDKLIFWTQARDASPSSSGRTSEFDSENRGSIPRGETICAVSASKK